MPHKNFGTGSKILVCPASSLARCLLRPLTRSGRISIRARVTVRISGSVSSVLAPACPHWTTGTVQAVLAITQSTESAATRALSGNLSLLYERSCARYRATRAISARPSSLISPAHKQPAGHTQSYPPAAQQRLVCHNLRGANLEADTPTLGVKTAH